MRRFPWKIWLIVAFRVVITLTLLGLGGVMGYHLSQAYRWMLQADDAFRRIPDYQRYAAQAEADQQYWQKRYKLIADEVGVPKRNQDALLGIDDDLKEFRKVYGEDLSIKALTARIAEAKQLRNNAEKRWTDGLAKWDAGQANLAEPMNDQNLRVQERQEWDRLRAARQALLDQIKGAKDAFLPQREELPKKLEAAREAHSQALKAYYDELLTHWPGPVKEIEKVGIYQRAVAAREAWITAGLKESFDAIPEPDGKVIEVGKPKTRFARINLGTRHHVRLGMHFDVWRYDLAGRKEKVGEVELTKVDAQTSECLLLPPQYRKPYCPQCGWVAPDQNMLNCPYCTAAAQAAAAAGAAGAGGGRAGAVQKLERDVYQGKSIPQLEPWEMVRPGDYLYNPLYLKKRLKHLFYIAEDTVMRSRTEIANYIKENGDDYTPFDDPGLLLEDGRVNPDMALAGNPNQIDFDKPGQPNLEVHYIVLGHGPQSERLRTEIVPMRGLKYITEQELFDYYGRPFLPSAHPDLQHQPGEIWRRLDAEPTR